MITEEEFLAWQDNPVTQTVMEFAKRKRQARKDDWESGVYNEPTFEAGLQRQSVALGYCSAYLELNDLTFETLQAEFTDE